MYDPLSVRSVAFCLLLAAALKTTLLRHGFYFHATVVFRCVLRTSQKNYSIAAQCTVNCTEVNLIVRQFGYWD